MTCCNLTARIPRRRFALVAFRDAELARNFELPRPWTSGPNALSTILDTFIGPERAEHEGLLVCKRDFIRTDPLNKDNFYTHIASPAHSGVRSPLHNYYSSANGGIGGVLVCTAPRFSKRTEYLGKERAQMKHGARNVCIRRCATCMC